MSTNYYIRKVVKDNCPTCGKGEEIDEFHIGKNSCGWSFLLNSHNKTVCSFPEMKKILEDNDNFIYNEYGDKVTLGFILDVIEKSQGGKSLLSDASYKNIADLYEFIDKDGYRFHAKGDFC